MTYPEGFHSSYPLLVMGEGEGGLSHFSEG